MLRSNGTVGFWIMPRTTGPSSTLLLVILVAAALISAVYLPIAPSISIAFTVGFSPTTLKPTVSVVTWSYSKVSLSSSAGVNKGQLVVSYANITGGQVHTLSISVSYNGQIISAPVFMDVTQGTFQARVVYWPRPEQTNIPYVVAIAVSLGPTVEASALVSIFPS